MLVTLEEIEENRYLPGCLLQYGNHLASANSLCGTQSLFRDVGNVVSTLAKMNPSLESLATIWPNAKVSLNK